MRTKEIIRNYWDYRSETYDEDQGAMHDHERDAWKSMLFQTIQERSNEIKRESKNLKALDVGTGPGFLALLLAEMGHSVTAVDLSENMLKKARKNAEDLSLDIGFVHGDAEDLAFPDKSFDLVVNKYLLWTLPDPKKALAEWMRVTKDDGMLIVVDGSWYDKSIKARFRDLIKNERDSKKRPYMSVFSDKYSQIEKDLPLYRLKYELVMNMMESTGFSDIKIQRVDTLYRSTKFKDKLLRWLGLSTPIYLISARKKILS